MAHLGTHPPYVVFISSCCDCSAVSLGKDMNAPEVMRSRIYINNKYILRTYTKDATIEFVFVKVASRLTFIDAEMDPPDSQR